jgi:tetratricopeptide (TPR) repeat protein
MGSLGKFAKGEQLCEKGLSFATKINHILSLGTSEYNYGVLFITKGDGEKALKHFKRSIEYLEKAQAVIFLPITWSMLGYAYYLLDEFDTALKFMEKGLKMQIDIGLPFLLSFQHFSLSIAHFNLGNLSEAKIHAEQGVNLARTNKEKWMEGLSWIQMGRVIGKMEESQIDTAEENILRGMRIVDELEQKPHYAGGYLALGELYADAGRKEKALENLKKAEELYQQMGMDYWLARTRKVLETVQ